MKTIVSGAAVEPAAVKLRQRAAWAAGDYGVVGTTLQIVGESLCEAVDLRAGSRVLDVAAGNGNATLAALRCGCEVTSTDYVPALLEEGRRRSEAEGGSVRFQEADAEDLPFPDASFDAVLSTFGVMFTPDQVRAASELLRICKRGGRIGLANWTPDGFVGRMFRTIATYSPPPAGSSSPLRWGTREGLEELFGSAVTTLRLTLRQFHFRYRSSEHWLETFKTYYGPLNRTLAGLEPRRAGELSAELLALADRGNRSGDRTLILPSAYLEAVLERR